MSGSELKKSVSDLIDKIIKEKMKEQLDVFISDLDVYLLDECEKNGSLILRVDGEFSNDPTLKPDFFEKRFNLADVARRKIATNDGLDDRGDDWLEIYATEFEKIANIFRSAMKKPDPS